MNNRLFDDYLKGGYDDICDFETYKNTRLKNSSKLRKSFVKKMIADKKHE